jgi:hypothetical protein
MLVSLIVGTYEVRRLDDLRWHGIHTKFHDDPFRNSSVIEITTSTILEATVLVLLMRGIYKLRLCIASGGTIYIPSFIYIGSDVQKFSGINRHVGTQTDMQSVDPIRLLLFICYFFFKIRIVG